MPASNGFLRYEHRTQPLLPGREFARRFAGHVTLALLVVAAALAPGIAGYHWIARLGWLDAFVNAAMILSGMGPVYDLASEHTTNGAKWFAGFYALFSGLVFVVVASIVAAPVLHRVLHKLHLDEPVD